MLRRLIGEDIELVTRLAPGTGRVKADPSQLEQVILNLVVNARDAMPRGGRLTIETANVELDAAAPAGLAAGPYVSLAVSDTGVGMDADVRARIFEPFFTTEEPGKGTGLGLSTAYGIIQQSGGGIEVDRAVDRGARFTVYLARAFAPPEPPAAGAASSPGGSETVLLVEDEEGLRDLTREVLLGYGYAVLTARDGEEALAVADRHRGDIHLLVTDVVMPQMSGRDLATRLLARRPAARVLYMSGYTAGMIEPHGVLEGGAALLPKPFTPADLARKVRDVLERAEPPSLPGAVQLG
jgi:CheY-like chemotaxis protein